MSKKSVCIVSKELISDWSELDVILTDARATQSATGGSEKQNCLAERKVSRSESRVRTAGGPDRISRREYLFSHKNLKQLSPVDCLM